ncbi:sensor histidine kinase [Microbacterium sp. M28]|uniref:sensor histidine kinase n=1 Tax=Microbacterium sp. M28 TaxID=2962064 RepID=UPI0021F44222|nr:sensor histidine kinase [Microbacterium sp. M28]UYO95695.1 sensor histidine kinase [Microbacterium sp. M28]
MAVKRNQDRTTGDRPSSGDAAEERRARRAQAAHDRAQRKALAAQEKAEARKQARARRREKRLARLPAWMRDRQTVMLVILSVIAVTLYAVLVPVHAAEYGSPVAFTMLLAAPLVAAPLVSTRQPTLAIILFAASALLMALMVPRDVSLALPWPWSVPMLLAFVVAVVAPTFQHGWRTGLVMFASGTAAGLTAALMLPGFTSGNSLIVTTSVVGGLYLIAVLITGRLRVGHELTRERALTAQEQAKRELVEERTRIARELHDVVAHSMSLIQVQASTARYRVPDLAPQAVEEFDDIAGTARSALVEMRRILGILRTDDHTAELTPQRGIDDIPGLVETTRRAGAEVGLSMAISGDIAAATQIAAYRITQESLSNAVRHAPGSTVTVVVTADEDIVTVAVRNSPVAETAPSSSGHGLRGMRERTALLGGSVEAGPDAQGGWTVTAALPRHPSSPPQKGSA